MIGGVIRTTGSSYWTQRDGGGGETDEPAIARVRLVDGVRVLVAELVHDLGDPVVVSFCQSGPDDGLESVEDASVGCLFCPCCIHVL